jgi:4-amino-4-deoxy-L-arabinose transferase-like glycosyltransferase
MRLWLCALLALTLARLILAASLPLVPDESYYFLWSQHLQPGYFDHPPMVAFFIRAGTYVFGDNALGIRCCGPIAAAIGSVMLWNAGETLFPHRQAGLIAAALLNATLMVGAGAIIITPDTPLLLFWTAGLAALARFIAGANPRWWLAVGVAAGCALLSKYTGLLFIGAVFIWLITAPAGRAALRTKWPWAGVALALLIFAPDIGWNAAHGWVSYLKQGGRVTHFDAARSVQFLAEFLVSQFLLATPLIFILTAIGLRRLGGTPSPAGHLLVWLTVVPGVVFLEHVISGRVQPNWAAIMYPSACLAAAALPMAILRRWLTLALALGFALTMLASAQALTYFVPLPVRWDPVALQLAGWPQLAVDAAATHPAFLTSDEYATAASLAMYAPADIPVVGFVRSWDHRWAYLSAPSANLAGQTGILISRRSDSPCPVILGTITRRQGDHVIDTYKLCRFAAPNAGVLLPRP